MVEAIGILLQLAIGIAFPWWVIRRDITRLDPVREARAWNEASLQAAVVAFGPIALVVHFARTRRSVAGLAQGLGFAAVALVAAALVGSALHGP
jgi:hypothetical protein